MSAVVTNAGAETFIGSLQDGVSALGSRRLAPGTPTTPAQTVPIPAQPGSRPARRRWPRGSDQVCPLQAQRRVPKATMSIRLPTLRISSHLGRCRCAVSRRHAGDKLGKTASSKEPPRRDRRQCDTSFIMVPRRRSTRWCLSSPLRCSSTVMRGTPQRCRWTDAITWTVETSADGTTWTVVDSQD